MEKEIQFLNQLKRLNKKKLVLKEIIALFIEIYPEDYYGHSSFNQFLVNVLNSLANNQLIRLPKGEKYWNHSYNPNLPNWIIIQGDEKESEFSWKEYPWHYKLAWIPQLQSRPRDINILLKLNYFFKEIDQENLEFIPVKERSLQIFGDEKKLQRIISNKWFKLTLFDLKCYPTFEPFVSKTFCNAKSLNTIIIENRDTFMSFCKINSEFDSPPFKHVIYGNGNQIESNILWIKDLDSNITKIQYFGDIDMNGFLIPFRTNKKLIENNFKPRIELATHFYSKMILYSDHKNLKLQKENEKIYEFLKPFNESERLIINNLLAQGERVAQELLKLPEIRKIISEYYIK
ncbi:MAG: hypothetical protein EAX96_06090 [Candidatus Lokiarchaeota archaeon]|nr:hypothetical protein [Candidatus Lokiarchaeota archaeon]